MARKAITIEERLRDFCCTATTEEIRAAQAMLDLAVHIRSGGNGEPPRKRTRKDEPQAKLAGVQ